MCSVDKQVCRANIRKEDENKSRFPVDTKIPLPDFSSQRLFHRLSPHESDV